MSIDYNNIKDLLSIVYEIAYNPNKDTFNKYVYKPLESSKITIKDLIKDNFDYKIILNSSFNSKDNFKVIDLTSDKIIIKKYFKEFPITIVIQKYNKNNSFSLQITDILYELFINQLISELVIIDKIPFYLLNICNFNINLQVLNTYPDFYNLISKKFTLIDNNNDDNTKLCFSIYEHYSSYQTLKSLLDEDLDNNDLYNLFFQMLFSHAYINYKFGNFVHNYFCIESFLVNKLNKPINKLLLKLGKENFNISNVKFICKLFNYRKSKLNINEYNNPTYDVYFLLKSIYDYTKNKIIFEKIKIIINNIFPIDLIKLNLMDENKFQTLYSINLIPIEVLLKNNFFSTFINMKSTNISDTSSDTNVIVGYRKLTNNQSGGALKKISKKSSKKSSKKVSKKPSKKVSKKDSKKSKKSRKLSRSNDTEDESETIDLDDEEDESESDKSESDESNDSEDNKKNKKNKKSKEITDLESDETENLELTSDQESQNEDLLTDGDDDNFNPIDLEEEGTSNKYKKMMKKLLSENKKLKNKMHRKSSSKKNKHSKKNKKDSSTEISFSDSNDDNGINSLQNNSMQNMMQPPMHNMMQPPMQNMMQQPMQNMMQPPMQNMIQPGLSNLGSSSPFVSLEGNLNNVMKLKSGKNTNFSSILQNISDKDLIPIIPEMQGLFTAENISRENPQEFSSEINMGREPKIMDPGLINNSTIPSFISGSNNKPMPANITNAAFSSLNGMRGGSSTTLEPSKLEKKKSVKKHFFLTKN